MICWQKNGSPPLTLFNGPICIRNGRRRVAPTFPKGIRRRVAPIFPKGIKLFYQYKHVPSLGLNIIFDSVQQVNSCTEIFKTLQVYLQVGWPFLTARVQRVRMIELYKPQVFAVDFGGVACCGPKALPTFPSVYHGIGPRLGPNAPGQYRHDEQAYHLIYPGVILIIVM